MEHVGSDQSSPRNTRGSSTWSLPPVPGVAPLEEAETGWRRSTEVAIGARARSVPDRSVSRGAQRCRRTTPGCQFGCISAGQSSATGESGKIPKLRARVRFSSPAPHESPRPAARGFFVVQTCSGPAHQIRTRRPFGWLHTLLYEFREMTPATTPGHPPTLRWRAVDRPARRRPPPSACRRPPPDGPRCRTPCGSGGSPAPPTPGGES